MKCKHKSMHDDMLTDGADHHKRDAMAKVFGIVFVPINEVVNWSAITGWVVGNILSI